MDLGNRIILHERVVQEEIRATTTRLPGGGWIGRVDLVRTSVEAQSGIFKKAHYTARVLTDRGGIREAVQHCAEDFASLYVGGGVGLEAFNECSNPSDRDVPVP